MGLTLKLDDTELPASPSFIEFLHASLTGSAHHVGNWYAQDEENLNYDPDRYADIEDKARIVMGSKDGVARVIQSYRYFKEILIGRPETVQRMKRFHFFFVIGIPRTGGTYLIKQLYRAIGIDYTGVQNALAHDGFPNLALVSFDDKGGNMATNSILQLAEYLTMVEIYFTENSKLAYKGGAVVPKKLTKAVYNFPLVQELFGAETDFLVTLRHPLAMMNSVLEKSGGMPDGGCFAVRSAIERWALEDWTRWGDTPANLLKLPYHEIMLGYWKRYHFQLALTGIAGMTTTRIVPYGREPMTRMVEEMFADFGVKLEPEEFKIGSRPEFDADIEAAAEKSVDQVASFWRDLGLSFPRNELALCQ